MKIIKILVILIMISLGNLKGSELTFSSNSPKSNDTIYITYSIDKRFSSYGSPKLYIYRFKENNDLPIAEQIDLEYEEINKNYKSKMIVDDVDLFIIFQIGFAGNNKKDNNFNNFWSLNIYKSNKIKENSKLYQSLFHLGNVPENIQPIISFKSALSSLKSELENYPNNLTTNIALNSLELDLKLIDFKEFENKTLLLLKNKVSSKSESENRAVIRALRTINKSAQADIIEKNYIKEFPKSKLAEEILLSNLSGAQSLEEFDIMCKEYFKTFENSQNYESIMNAYIEAYISSKKIEVLLNNLNSINKVPSVTYIRLANEIISNKDLLKDSSYSFKLNIAKELDKKSNGKLIADIIDFETIDKQVYYTQTEWEYYKNINRGMIAYYKANFYDLIDDKSLSINQYEESNRILKENSFVSSYEKIISFHYDIQNYNLANMHLKEAIINNKISDIILEYREMILAKLYPEKTDIEKSLELVNLFTESDSIFRINLTTELTKIDFEKINLKDMEGNYINLDKFSKSPIFLTFWATWCEPCEEMLNNLDDIVENDKFKFLQIFSVNIWEQEANKNKVLKDFFENEKPLFNVLIDENDRMPFEYGISGLPFSILYHPSKKVGFIYKGSYNIEDLNRNLLNGIKILNEF